jgi:capsid protein
VNFEVFVRSVMKYISGSIGAPIETVELLFGQNYSASRAALVLFWNNIVVRRSDLENDFLNVLYEMWMIGEVSAGTINAPNFNLPYARRAWLNASWVGIPKPSIDPFKEAKAREVILGMGLSTREKESRENNGSSFDDNITRIKSENEKLAEALKPLTNIKAV